MKYWVFSGLGFFYILLGCAASAVTLWSLDLGFNWHALALFVEAAAFWWIGFRLMEDADDQR
jgi:hypothetical protein